MATILFQAAGAALGSVFGPVGAMLGRAVGGLAGSVVDRSLLSGRSTISATHLSTARIGGADEGTAIPRLYGTARIGGTLIWATRFEEEMTSERTGGKATGGTRVESYNYYANFALGLCEGEIALVRRVWADGREIDLTGIEMRVYRGTEDQLPDPLIEAKQGAGNAPAYRGLAYVVFERLPLADFGNRIPVLQFEVVRPIGQLEHQIRAVTLIPGATEFGYATAQVKAAAGDGSAVILNRHNTRALTDWQASLDELQALCPNLQRVALVVSWFGTDLRAGECRILPGVETLERAGESQVWSVAGIARADAHLISTSGGGPAYGGTPDDASVRQAIAGLSARGIEVYLYPFIMMDVPADNALPDPHGGAEQAAYPWRGRITCHLAPGQSGSTDRSAAAAAQVSAFCNGTEGYRRMILHYADLAAASGGVKGFILGSEFCGLTRVRDAADGFPFVAELVRLAADVRARLGSEVKLTYGADWTEYFGYQPQDGSGDVYFNLDPLWASPDIDAVGIDNYMPLADWRDSDLGEANPDGFRLAEDEAAMQAAITSGEGYDWYYQSGEARRARQRSPITDGGANKPWVFRYKDIESWWANRHYERRGGRELTSPTAWVPKAKPIWLTELGCPAIEKGANQPNLFVDPKSSESGKPYFSNAGRSDSMQRRFLQAHHHWWQGANAPRGIVDPDHIFVWTWDARPYAAFPTKTEVWSDGQNWVTGHWLTGRLGAGTLADVIAAILTDHGFPWFDVSAVAGDLTGYVQADTVSARSLIEPLAETLLIDVIEDRGVLRFRSRPQASLPPKIIDVLAEKEGEPAWSETRGHDSDFAAEALVSFANPVLDYEQASVRSRRIVGESNRILQSSIAGVLYEEAALGVAERLLRDNHIARRTLKVPVSPAMLSLSAGDPIRLSDGPDGVYLVTRIEDGEVRQLEARRHEPAALLTKVTESAPRANASDVSADFAPRLLFLDLPRFEAGDATGFARVAGYGKPWRRMLISSSQSTEGFRSRARLEKPASIGRLTAPFASGISGRFDSVNSIEADFLFGSLSSADRQAVLNDANRLAVRADNGAFEIVGFASAEETAPGHWRLTNLLRGLAGTEDAMQAGASGGADVVLLNDSVVSLGLTTAERGITQNWITEAIGLSGARTAAIAFAGGARAETPLNPVHLKARRFGAGIRFSWIRRGRVEADDWTASDIPLDEPDERYRLEILSGGAVVRRLEVSEPACLYGSDQELADFGAVQAAFTLRLCQMGRAVPLGISAIFEIQPKTEGDL